MKKALELIEKQKEYILKKKAEGILVKNIFLLCFILGLVVFAVFAISQKANQNKKAQIVNIVDEKKQEHAPASRIIMGVDEIVNGEKDGTYNVTFSLKGYKQKHNSSSPQIYYYALKREEKGKYKTISSKSKKKPGKEWKPQEKNLASGTYRIFVWEKANNIYYEKCSMDFSL